MKKLMLLSLSAMMLSPAAAVAGGKPGAAPAIPSPKPGMGQVVFFRPGGMGALIKCTVREDGKMVARVSPNRYYVVDMKPGVHTFTAKSEATDAVTVQVEPDETSFVKCKIGMGIGVGRPNLSPSTEQEFAGKAGKVKPMDVAKLKAEIAKENAKPVGAAKAADTKR
jgi:hypothetical protein